MYSSVKCFLNYQYVHGTVLVTGDSMGTESKLGIPTTFWSHCWNLKSIGQTGINPVMTNKCKMVNSD